MLLIFSGRATCSKVRRKQGFPGGNVKSSRVIQFDRQGDVERRLGSHGRSRSLALARSQECMYIF